MTTKSKKYANRKKRHVSIRQKIKGTSERPRLNVFRSSKHIYAQVIDDVKGITLTSASTLENDINVENGGNEEAAKKIGEIVAKRASEKGCDTVVFDRGGFIYHGRVQALAEAARENGLNF
ncbi:50S ribosomal protein L18 [Salibacterium aidingense]|uniref:50S ribosomal protein L18 n=1 Tax=Salibacterium aidingense TaxID=384933 RepID=UPI0004146CCA|nr:50S ribosomal protein L18 [Salibacterium aidingense]